MCNARNGRLEVGLAGEVASVEPCAAREDVFVARGFGLPPERFEPALRCPGCGGEVFEARFGGGVAAGIGELAAFVDKRLRMLPGTKVGAVGRAGELGLEPAPRPELLVSIELVVRESGEGTQGRWYVEADDEAVRACVVRTLHELLTARGCTQLVERAVWSGIYLDEQLR